MTQNTTTAKAHKATPVGTFNMRMGNTTYVIGVHFSKESKDTQGHLRGQDEAVNA